MSDRSVSVPTALDAPVTAAQKALLERCVRLVINQSRDLINALQEAALAHVLREEAQLRHMSERGPLREVIDHLMAHGDVLQRAFPVELEKALRAAAQPLSVSPVSSEEALKARPTHYLQFELVDDQIVHENLTYSQAEQAALAANDAELNTLDALMSTLRGLGTVRQSVNPFRPASFTLALRQALAKTELTPAGALRLFGVLSVPLGEQLKAQYVALTELLHAAEIKGASYVFGVQVGGGVTGASPPRRPAPPEDEEEEEEEDEDDQELRMTVDQLQQLIDGNIALAQVRQRAGHAGPTVPAHLSSAPSVPRHAQASVASFVEYTEPAALKTLEAMHQVNRAVNRLAPSKGQMPRDAQSPRPGRGGFGRAVTKGRSGGRGVGESFPYHDSDRDHVSKSGADSPISAISASVLARLDDEDQYDALRLQARLVGQGMSLKTVTLMVEQLATDPALLPPIQAAVQSLQAPLLRLAAIDSRFFSNSEHPARQMLDAISETGRRFTSETQSGFVQYLQPLQRMVEELRPVPIESAEPFALGLARLQQSWYEQGAGGRAEAKQKADLQHRAAQRDAAAAAMGEGIRARADAVNVQQVVLDFVAGPWAKVVSQAQLTQAVDGAPNVHAFTERGGATDWAALIPDLFWSVNEEQARSDTRRLIKIIPSLLSRMRTGLATIDYPPAATDAFFKVLMSLHHKILMQKAVTTPAPLSKSTPVLAVAPRPPSIAPMPPVPSTPALQEELAKPVQPDDAASPNLLEDFDFSGLGTPSRGLKIKKPSDLVATMPPQSQGVREILSAGLTVVDMAIGDWYEVTTDSGSMCAKLDWVSPEGTMVMFATKTGSNRSMTQKAVNRLLQEGRIVRLLMT